MLYQPPYALLAALQAHPTLQTALPPFAVGYAPQVGSTQTWAWHMAQTGWCSTTQPLLLVGGQQTQGRGTHGRGWASPHGGVYASLLYPPQHTPPPLEAHGLSLSQAVAWGLWAGLVETFPTLQPRLVLRGINDLYLTEAKLGGVLVESRGGGKVEGPHTVVIGFGLNVWQAPPTLADGRHVSTSLQAHVPANTLLPCPTLAVLLARHVQATLALWQEGQLPSA